MSSNNWVEVKEVLEQLLETNLSERAALLEKLALSPEMKVEVESLLSFETEAERMMDLPALEFSKDLIADDDLTGQEIGAYRVISELGHGGMGAVYLAERIDGKFNQRVALKMLKRELNTDSLRRRFQHEREILASLEHPNIARLLDAGTTDDKVPFIAMEYVDGQPIDDYCNQHGLDLNARLELFRKVCSTVNFAHQNLVVHRDLKPSNILVTEDGEPKLLDFGISKILSTDIENTSTVTKLGVMTPSYASPEQLRNESVTTSTDVYSLGIILYELLSGHRPFESKEANLKEIFQAVIDVDPPLPSEVWRDQTLPRYGETKNAKNAVVTHSNVTASAIRGDLDNIILKALKKEPERRYSSAENLSNDIKRHLDGLPVTARPDTFSYRAEKFIKRNSISVVAGGLILIAIIGGVGATLWQARIAASERDRARVEAEKVKKINSYTQNILNFSNPHWLSSNPTRNRDAKISDALEEALKNIDTDLADEPEIQAEILFTIGKTYTGQGQFDKAEKLLTQSIEKFDQVFGDGNLRSEQAKVILGDTLYGLGRFDESENFYSKAINYFRMKVAEDNTQLKWLVIALNNLGNVYSSKGRYAESGSTVSESLELAKDLSGTDRYALPIVLGNLGRTSFQKGDYPVALDYFDRAFEIMRSIGNEHRLEGAIVVNDIGRTYNAMGEFQKADEYYQKSYEMLLKNVGEESFYTNNNRMHSAYNLYKLAKYEEAETIVKRILDINKKLYPNGHITISFQRQLLSLVYSKMGKLKQAENEAKASLEIILKNYKEPNPEISSAKMTLGENLVAQKRFAEAKVLLKSALEGYVKTKGEDHVSTKECLELLRRLP